MKITGEKSKKQPPAEIANRENKVDLSAMRGLKPQTETKAFASLCRTFGAFLFLWGQR